MFAELINYSKAKTPREAQDHARAAFPDVLARSQFALARPANTLSDPNRIVIGVAASYSQPDMALLDAIHDKLGQYSHSAEVVEVFDLSSCESATDIDSFIPGIGAILQTPALGIWRNGHLVKAATGHEAVTILRAHFQVDPERPPTDQGTVWTRI